jgi:hypothetical protein
MEKWFCIWNDLANPKNGLNLVPNLAKRRDVGNNYEKNNNLTTNLQLLFTERPK